MISEKSIYVCANEFTSEVVVSVLMWTFNDIDFVAQSIMSVLDQKTTFGFELVISDDDSTDGTTELIIGYQKAYPAKIRLVLSRENLWGTGLVTQRLLQTARGKYVALTHGDDYWTDPLKLQRQVDVLEDHSECVACHHWQKYACKTRTGRYSEQRAPTEEGQGYLPKRVGTVEDIFANRLRIKTRTVMYRNLFASESSFPQWLHRVAYGDVPLSMILGAYGDFYFIDEPMAVYRQTGQGVSKMGPKDPEEFWIRQNLNWIDIWEYGLLHHNCKYAEEAVGTIVSFYDRILSHRPGTRYTIARVLLRATLGSHLPWALRTSVVRQILWMLRHSHAKQSDL